MTDAEIDNRLANCTLSDDRGTSAAGMVCGDWKITAFIAKGGMSEVYCAEHLMLGTPAAIKVLSEPLTASRRARFLREAKLLAELKLPAFPAFHGYGEINDRPYIVEELLEPGELPIGDGPRAKYLLAICDGLKALHAKGIVHRDLKPANILFRKTGEPVIVDLGLAKSVEVPLVSDGVSIVDGKAVGVGTPEFAAPEQFMGGDITPAADVHALGVLAEKLIVEKQEGWLSRSWGVLARAEWKKIIRRATSSIASERYQSIDAFAAAIRRRHWLRNGIFVGFFFAAAGLLLGLVAAFSKPTLPDVLELRGQTIVINEPLVLKPGRTYRVIGPGTLDADLSGPESTVLWMTNCVVLNRSRKVYPDVKLKYQITCNVYLNFINIDDSVAPWSDRFHFMSDYDGAFNEVRFGGPDTISGLMRLKNKEAFDLMKKDL